MAGVAQAPSQAHPAVAWRGPCPAPLHPLEQLGASQPGPSSSCSASGVHTPMLLGFVSLGRRNTVPRMSEPARPWRTTTAHSIDGGKLKPRRIKDEPKAPKKLREKVRLSDNQSALRPGTLLGCGALRPSTLPSHSPSSRASLAVLV